MELSCTEEIVTLFLLIQPTNLLEPEMGHQLNRTLWLPCQVQTVDSRLRAFLIKGIQLKYHTHTHTH